jgi:hypothetical protein
MRQDESREWNAERRTKNEEKKRRVISGQGLSRAGRPPLHGIQNENGYGREKGRGVEPRGHAAELGKHNQACVGTQPFERGRN